MYSTVLKITECMEILRRFGIRMSEPAFRQAIRKNQVKNTYSTSKKEGINIPLISLMDFMISRVSGNHTSFELGRFYQDQTITSELLPTSGNGGVRSYLSNALLKNEYIYLIQEELGAVHKCFYINIDYNNKIIHILDDADICGLGILNSVSTSLIKDIWKKLGEDITNQLVNNTTVNVYYRSLSQYSTIRGYSFGDEERSFAPKEPLYDRFKNLVEETRGDNVI